jgi:lipopolysaccharide export LptBFGC system permease protein LptF
MKTKLFTLAVLIFGITAANAQTATPHITKHQRNQQARIVNGVKNGELTKKETVKLEKQQQHIKHEKMAAKKDGKVTVAERKNIRHDQRVASRSIYNKKHNAVKK